jgi:hypothetical protein
MKKAFTLFVLILTPTMAFAQGTVVFNNQTGLVRQCTSPMDTTLINSPIRNSAVVQRTPFSTAGDKWQI